MPFGPWFERDSGEAPTAAPSPSPTDLSYPVPQDYLRMVDGHWRPITLYGITGWWAPDYNCGPFTGQAVAFGGYLMLADGDGDFAGHILDPIGYAKVEGILTDDSLTFVKEYEGGITGITADVPITYTFKRVDDEFVGTFQLQPEDHELKGQTHCRLQPVVADAFGVIHQFNFVDPDNN